MQPIYFDADTSLLQVIVHNMRYFVGILKTTDLFVVFGVHISVWQVFISLFVLSMIMFFFTGDGDIDD